MTGYGRADKKQMQIMVKTLLQLDNIPKPDDAADALAVAKSQREIYAKAVESGKQTASGLYKTADKGY